MKIQILENEYWWGGIVDIGTEMPWDETSVCAIDPSTMGKDQRSPLFLSSLGRCIWSEDYGVYDFYPGRFENPKAMIDELHELVFLSCSGSRLTSLRTATLSVLCGIQIFSCGIKTGNLSSGNGGMVLAVYSICPTPRRRPGSMGN